MTNKSFSIVLISTLSALIAGNVLLLELFSIRVLQPIDNLKVHTGYAEQRLATAKVIALGDSHTSYGLNIDSVDFFNLGYPSDNTIVMYAKLKRYLELGMQPDILLLQADLHMFTPYREKLDYSQYRVLFDQKIRGALTNYYGKSSLLFDKSLFGFDLYQFRSDISSSIYKLLKYYILGGVFRQKNNEILPNGLIKKKAYWNILNESERLSSTQGRIRDQLMESGALQQEILLRYYEKIIELAQEKGIRVVMLRYPVTIEYRKMMDPNVLMTMEGYFESVSKRYEIDILNFYASIDHASAFADSDHLNYKASKEFGNRVVEQLCNLKTSVHGLDGLCQLN